MFHCVFVRSLSVTVISYNKVPKLMIIPIYMTSNIVYNIPSIILSSIQYIINESNYELRNFISRMVVSTSEQTQTPSWKAALWNRESIEPAMLRVPIIIIGYVFLWAGNLWLLERNSKMQYLNVLSLKSGEFIS